MSHILLIEDNQANADMIVHILVSAGYEVKHFLKGLEGAKSARAEPPTLILMDFNLPDIDGRTLSLLLKQQLRHVPIVGCTARVGDVELQIAAKFGCSAVLNKPFTPNELLTVVDRTLKEQINTPSQ